MKLKNFIIILITLLFFSYCSIFQKIFMKSDPEFKIHSMNLESVNFNEMVFKIDTELMNHYQFGLPESELLFDIKVNDKLLSNYKSAKFQIAANSSVNIPIYLKLKFVDIINILQNLQNEKFIKLKLDGGVNFPLNIPALPKNVFVPFRLEKTLPAFAPKISISKINFQLQNTSFQDMLLGNTKLKIDLQIQTENQGGIPFQLKTDNLKMALNQIDVINVNNELLNPDKKQNLNISSEVELGDSLKVLLNTIKANQPLQYELQGDLKFLFEKTDFNEYKIPLLQKGNINLKP